MKKAFATGVGGQANPSQPCCSLPDPDYVLSRHADAHEMYVRHESGQDFKLLNIPPTLTWSYGPSRRESVQRAKADTDLCLRDCNRSAGYHRLLGMTQASQISNADQRLSACHLSAHIPRRRYLISLALCARIELYCRWLGPRVAHQTVSNRFFPDQINSRPSVRIRTAL